MLCTTAFSAGPLSTACVSTKLVRTLAASLEARAPGGPSSDGCHFTLDVQEEAARRLVDPSPTSADYRVISLSAQFYSRMSLKVLSTL